MKKKSARLKHIKTEVEKIQNFGDEKDTMSIDVAVKNADSFLSEYNIGGKEIISHETAKFIDNVTEPVKAKQKLHLKISCENYSDKKEDVYKQAIDNYYINKFAGLDSEFKHALLLSFIMLIAGVVSFIFLHFFAKWEMPYIVNMLLEIIGWVFVWEFVELVFFRAQKILRARNKTFKILTAKITFGKLNTKSKTNTK